MSSKVTVVSSGIAELVPGSSICSIDRTSCRRNAAPPACWYIHAVLPSTSTVCGSTRAMREQVRTSATPTQPALAMSRPKPKLIAMSAGTEITDCDRADALMSGPHQSQ